MTSNKPFEDDQPIQDGDSKSYDQETAQTFLTETSLAKRWLISIKKLQSDRIASRGVPYTKIGRLVRYRLSDVVAYENSGRRQNTSQELEATSGRSENDA